MDPESSEVSDNKTTPPKDNQTIANLTNNMSDTGQSPRKSELQDVEMEPTGLDVPGSSSNHTTVIDKEQPGHSQSLRDSCGSTSGVGSNGSNSSGSSRSSSATANSSSIKKRSNSSHRRNYRTAHPQVDSENSNDYDSGINQATSQRSGETNSAENDSSSNDEDLPLNKYRKSEKSNRRVTSDDSSAPGSSDRRDEAAPQEDSSRHSSTPLTPLAFSDSDDSHEVQPGNETQEASATRRPFEGFFNVYHRASSDSDSSLFAAELEEESSSSSSDNYLEDIDERPVDSSRPTSEAEDHGNSSQAAATETEKPNTETTKPKTKPRKAKAELPAVLKKKKPAGDWCGPKELFYRELGSCGKKQPQSSEVFRSKFYGSVFSAERLELMIKIDGHNGCVNCLNFNHSGTKLASGSDDLLIKIWNYSTGQCLTSFKSGHKANVFQAKFVPLIGLDTMIVSCARDSQVRLTELDSSGGVCSSKKLVQHHGPAHKLSISPDTPHVVFSCGEDGIVYSIDIRDEKPERLVKTTEKGKRVSLYSIHHNPFAPHEFCVSGRDQYVRIYDTRRLGRNSVSAHTDDEGPSTSNASYDSPLKKFCPHHLVESHVKTNVTAAVYNYNGKEILGSYNDENIYLFDATHSDMADCIKVYEGHRNNATVKGVNFFGDKSQFVVSGSDCGHLFIWDKETESIVNFQRGDETGVLNCLEGHPTSPILATSGLDHDIKIWIPSNEKPPQMGELATTIRRNLKGRADDLKNQPQFDQNVMWALWNHIRRSERARGRTGGEDDEDSDNSHPSVWSEDDEDDDDEEEDGAQRGVDCSIM